MKRTTYARARLFTGIGGVGTFVLLAAFLLVSGSPARLLAGLGGSPAADALGLLLLLGLAALVALPFDVLGGLVLPRQFGRPAPSAPRFWLAWARGVLALSLLSVSSGTVLLAAGRAGGRPAALLAFVTISLLLAWLQEPLARLVGGLRRALPIDSEPKRSLERDLILLEGSDPGFSGGFAGGLGGAGATLVMPARWARALDRGTLSVLIERRLRIARSGAWRRSVLAAVAWNTTGFALASILPGAGVQNLGQLVSTALGFTLWTFVGLLLLPTPSRRGTAAADAAVAQDDATAEQLSRAVKFIDTLQDDEPERSDALESIFHPVPAAGRRARALRPGSPHGDVPAASRKLALWHLARTALFLSHAGLSPLPRAVHCNAGRPELWVYLPADG